MMNIPARRSFPFAAAVAVGAALSACGGGGSGGLAPAPAPAPAPTTPNPAPPELAARQVVLQLQAGASIEAVAATHGLTRLSQFGQRPIHRLRIAEGSTLASVLDALRADARVRHAEANETSETPEGRRSSVWAIGNAADYTAQWAPQALRLPQAHGLSQGAGVRIAVLDTGIDLDHPALAGRLALDSRGGVLGRDFVDDDATPEEASAGKGYGHGTHVAGLVAAAAPAARLMPVRVLDAAGEGNAWVLAEALLWATDPDGNPASDDGAHVVNLSLGGLQPTRLLRNAVRLASCEFADDDDDDEDFEDPGFNADRARCATRHGAVVVAAAGNSGSASELHYPAAEAKDVPGALAVTASTEARRLWADANRGDWVQVAAPGEGITSTLPGGQYGVWSGTSMAAPWVAGAAALLIGTPSPNPQPGAGALRQWSPQDVAKRLSDRTAKLCGDTSLRQVDVYAASTDTSGLDPNC